MRTRLFSGECHRVRHDMYLCQRDIRKPALPPANLSPVLSGYVVDDGLPNPCRHFCGRDAELDALHAMLTEKGQVFLCGIPGIGKSELAKAVDGLPQPERHQRNDGTGLCRLPPRTQNRPPPHDEGCLRIRISAQPQRVSYASGKHTESVQKPCGGNPVLRDDVPDVGKRGRFA